MVGGPRESGAAKEVIARLTPEAERADIDEALAWYDERGGADLGNEFLRRVDACLVRIELHPRMYATVHRRTRRALVEVFPYQVMYGIGRTEIVVYGVFDCARDPKSWKRRSPR